MSDTYPYILETNAAFALIRGRTGLALQQLLTPLLGERLIGGRWAAYALHYGFCAIPRYTSINRCSFTLACR